MDMVIRCSEEVKLGKNIKNTIMPILEGLRVMGYFTEGDTIRIL